MNSAILTTQMLNFTGFVNETAVSACADGRNDGKTQDEYFYNYRTKSVQEEASLI